MRAVVQLQPSPCSIYSRDISAIGSASAAVASRMPGRNITRCASGCALLLTGLIDDVDLLRRFDHFPGSDEASGNDHAVASRDRHDITGMVGNDAGSLKYLAIL